MEGKFSKWETCLEAVVFLLLLVTGTYRIAGHEGDAGAVVMLLFTGILLFIVLTVAAFFPATWRMTEKQKEKIKDPARYQEKYRRGMVIVNVVLSLGMAALILTTP